MFVVMFLFLQNIRYTLIPTLVVPIAMLGSFATLLALGFSINVLTMFGMVLAIGIVVDDAIVVVENVERIMTDEGLDARAASLITRHSLAEARSSEATSQFDRIDEVLASLTAPVTRHALVIGAGFGLLYSFMFTKPARSECQNLDYQGRPDFGRFLRGSSVAMAPHRALVAP